MEDGEKNKMGVFWVKCLMKKGQGSVTLSLISDCQIVPKTPKKSKKWITKKKQKLPVHLDGHEFIITHILKSCN